MREPDELEKSMNKKVDEEFLKILKWASDSIVDPNIEDHEFEFCKNSIETCIEYIESKRDRKSLRD